MRLGLLCAFAVLLTASTALAQFDSATVVGTVRDATERGRARRQGHADRRRHRHLRRQDVERERQLRVSRGEARHLCRHRREERVRARAGRERRRAGRRAPARRSADAGGPGHREGRGDGRRRRCIETDSSQRGQVITGDQTRALPLLSREYSSLALLTTGVKLAGSSLTTGNTPREGALNVNGLRSTFNNFLIDGVDNNAYGTSNQGFSNQVMQPSPDAIGEFKVVTNNLSAEYGRAAGATINVNYRSGTNALHGSGWEFLRDTSMNATGFFKPATGQARARSAPVRRRRRRADREEQGVLLRRLRGPAPDAAGRPALRRSRRRRSGRAFSSVDVRDPRTGVVYPAGTSIPMTAFAREVLSALPDTNVAGQHEQLQQRCRSSPPIPTRRAARSTCRRARPSRCSAATGSGI